MNVRQRIALDNYCRFGFETVNPIFTYQVPTGLIILTVAAGHE